MIQIDEIGTIAERITKLVNHFCKGNKTAFGRAADIQSGVLAGIVGGRESKPGFEILQKLLTAYPTVNPTWLLFGRGQMIIQPPSTSNHEKNHSLRTTLNEEVREAEPMIESSLWTLYFEQSKLTAKHTVEVVEKLVLHLQKTDKSTELSDLLDNLTTIPTLPINAGDKEAQRNEAHKSRLDK